MEVKIVHRGKYRVYLNRVLVETLSLPLIAYQSAINYIPLRYRALRIEKWISDYELLITVKET